MFRVKVRALPRVLGLAIGLFATSVVTSTAFAAAGDASRAGASAGASPSSSSGAEPAVAVQGGFPGIHVMPGMPGYAQTRLGYLHYWSLGEGPAVLLLHGGPMFAVQYAKVMPLLAQAGFRAIAADLPGYGLSQLPDHPPSGEEYADALGQLLDQLRVKRANVVGMLTGGVVSLAFATHQTERTRCLVLQNTPLYSEEELAAQLAAPAPDTRIWADGRHATERWQARRAARKLDRASPEALQWQMVGTLLMGDPGGWWPGAGAGDYVSRSFDSAQAVRAVKAPTLLISLRDDAMLRHVERIRALRPDFRIASLEVGHSMVPYDDPQPWATAVIAFLRQDCAAR